MGPVAVIVLGVLVQDLSEMLLAGDQQVIQALAAQRSDKPLRKGVRSRRQLRPVQMTGTDVCG